MERQAKVPTPTIGNIAALSTIIQTKSAIEQITSKMNQINSRYFIMIMFYIHSNIQQQSCQSVHLTR